MAAGTKLYFDGSTCSNGHTAPRRWGVSWLKGKQRVTTKCEECRRANRAANRRADIGSRMRSLINQAIRMRLDGRLRRRSQLRADELLGIPVEDYMVYLESQFEPSWTWQNWGSAWQIDHIDPCHTFDLSDPTAVLLCFNYRNTRPLAVERNKWTGSHSATPREPSSPTAHASASSSPVAASVNPTYPASN